MSERRMSFEQREAMGDALWERFGVADELGNTNFEKYDNLYADEYGKVVTLGEIMLACFRRADTNFQLLRDFLEARIQMDSTEHGVNPQTTRPDYLNDF